MSLIEDFVAKSLMARAITDSVALMRFGQRRAMMRRLDHDQGRLFYSFVLERAVTTITWFAMSLPRSVRRSKLGDAQGNPSQIIVRGFRAVSRIGRSPRKIRAAYLGQRPLSLQARRSAKEQVTGKPGVLRPRAGPIGFPRSSVYLPCFSSTAILPKNPHFNEPSKFETQKGLGLV